MKKITSIILIIMLLACTFASVGFATGETGSISISKVTVVKGEDGEYTTPSSYAAYQMLELESYNDSEGLYNYKVMPKWEQFFAKDEIKQYFISNANGYIEWKPVEGEDIEKRAAEVSQLALTYVKEKNSDSDASNNITGYTDFTIVTTPVVDDATGLDVATIKISNLPFGYYLVDSTAGALCGLTTTNPNASFSAKNFAPTVDKQVKEDGITAGSPWGSTNDADIGQIVEFDSTITVRAGAENYVFHDRMSEGLELIVDSIELKHKDHDVNKNYYEIIYNPTDCDCTFEIEFKGDFYKNVQSGDRIVILYSARLTKDAVIGNEGNPNEVWLNYGDNSESTHDITVTKTYGFDLVKTTTDHKLLPGAKFKIYPTVDSNEPIQFVEDGTITIAGGDNTAHIIYRKATDEEIKDSTITKYTELDVEGGYIRIIGLDKSHYFLEETEAPDGYNKLSARKEISLEYDTYLEFDNNRPQTNTGFQVVNQAGSILPETGATGIKIFVGVGMFTVLASGLLLVTKKRMSMIED